MEALDDIIDQNIELRGAYEGEAAALYASIIIFELADKVEDNHVELSGALQWLSTQGVDAIYRIEKKVGRIQDVAK